MTALVPQNFGAPSKLLAGIEVENELSAGINAGLANLLFKGKTWSIKYRNIKNDLMRQDGDGPRGSVDIVIVKASNVLSKTWYEAGYVEGSIAKPDCSSNNGVTPNHDAPKKQSVSCASCPRNVFGGGPPRADGTPNRGKECADNKRLAVTDSANIENEIYGGAMLLRVPPSSLTGIATYGDGLKKMGYHQFAVVTRVSFDPQVAFPRLVFTPVRALTDAEVEKVLAMRNDPRIERVLLWEETDTGEVIPPPPMQFIEQAPIASQPLPQTPPQPAPVQQAAPVAPAPPPAPPKAKRRTAAQIAAEAAAEAPAAPAPSQSGFGVTSTTAGPALAPEPAPDAAFIDDLDAELDRLMPSQ
jgi:hypothetical protein